ncbi:multi-sensor hybrid histidine kinase [Opitutus terrae PB90-1]|uniref:histidine kinase n=1 Tax=Opitutus terrae (strain DSM 11246 / JCM 15787 / PB90-1) TaxID=452637 RepID=B1ZTC5_OPITP|nr:multi-sensor hybrid histidine kinase [Opitutus terrae PB90-1]
MLAVGAAALVRGAVAPLLDPDALQFAFFFPAIACAAWYGRLPAAIFAAVLSGVVAAIAFVAPTSAPLPLTARDWMGVFAFLAAAAPVIGAIELMHRANDRARAELRRRLQVDDTSRESEERFRTVADGLPLVVWVHDADGRQQFVNRTFCEFFGVKAEEMNGARWRELLHPDDAARYATEFLACVRDRRPFAAEVRVRRHDGQWRWCESWARPRWSASGEFCGFVGASADITDRKRSEAALAESQQRLQLALAGAETGVWSWEVATGRVHWSPELYRLFGISEFSGTVEAARQLVHPEDLARVSHAITDALEKREPYAVEFRIVRPDGSTHWMSDRGRADYDANGRPGRLLGVITDVTARKRVEAELEAARDQALAASRAKDRFLAMLSHELRTPLTPALMIAAEFECSPLVPAALHDDLAVVRASIELEARLIDDLLDVSRVTRGKLHLQFARCEGHAVLRQAVETVQPEFVTKHITLGWELDPSDAPLWGDSVRLQQVFWNILRNAAKFTPSGGSIRLRSQVADGTWRLEVIDTGIGIAPDDLERIFESFYQSGQGAEPRLGGLGLGLTISSSIVRDHGGKIWAESAGLDRGSTVIIELPLQPGSIQAAPMNLVGEPRPSRSLKILVVEDHAPTRAAFGSLLRRRGHTVTTAEGVDSAQREAANQCFDLVISDLGLLDGDGLQLMRHLRQVYGLRGIALSGHGMEIDIQNAYDAGFSVHLTKPVTLRKLDEALAQVMDTLPVA